MPDLPMLLGTARQRLDDRADRLALACAICFRIVRARWTAPCARCRPCRRCWSCLSTGWRPASAGSCSQCLICSAPGDRTWSSSGGCPRPHRRSPPSALRFGSRRRILSGRLRHAVSDARGRAGERLARLSEATIRRRAPGRRFAAEFGRRPAEIAVARSRTQPGICADLRCQGPTPSQARPCSGRGFHPASPRGRRCARDGRWPSADEVRACCRLIRSRRWTARASKASVPPRPAIRALFSGPRSRFAVLTGFALCPSPS